MLPTYRWSYFQELPPEPQPGSHEFHWVSLGSHTQLLQRFVPPRTQRLPVAPMLAACSPGAKSLSQLQTWHDVACEIPKGNPCKHLPVQDSPVDNGCKRFASKYGHGMKFRSRSHCVLIWFVHSNLVCKDLQGHPTALCGVGAKWPTGAAN